LSLYIVFTVSTYVGGPKIFRNC